MKNPFKIYADIMDRPLHDYMAGVLGKPNAGMSSYSATETGYWPAAEFQVYKYYGTNMIGYRVETLPTSDLAGDVYATVGTDKARLLVGARITTGTWGIQLNGLESLGFAAAGTIDIQTWGFDGNSNHFTEYDAPANLGIYGHAYTGGAFCGLPSNLGRALQTASESQTDTMHRRIFIPSISDRRLYGVCL